MAPTPLSFHGYSRFCALSTATGARAARRRMRQTHVVGEALFFDFGYEISMCGYSRWAKACAAPHSTMYPAGETAAGEGILS